MKTIAIYGHLIRQSPEEEAQGGWGGRLEALLLQGHWYLMQGELDPQAQAMQKSRPHLWP